MKALSRKQIKTTLNFGLALSVLALLIASIQPASAKGKGHHFNGFKHGKHYKNPYLLESEYICEPQYIKTWVYSPEHGRKIKRLIRIEDRCNVHYK